MTATTSRPRFRFPLWGKLAVAFLLVFLLPTITATLLFVTTTQNIDRENITSYVQQNGQRQRQVISNVFIRARENLNRFATNRDSNQLLVGLLLADVQSEPPLPSATTEEVTNLLLSELLDPATTLFENVRVLNLEGTLVASAGNIPPGSLVVGQDNSSSVAYQQMTNIRAADRNISQITVVTRLNNGTIELVNTITLRNTDNVIGYVIATLDVENSILPTLTFTDNIYPAYSFLISESGVIITNDGFREIAETSRNTEAVDLAFQDQTGFSFYRLDGGIGQEVGGYYAPLLETPFVLLTQLNTQAIQSQRQQYLNAILFPVMVGIIVLGAVLALFSRHITYPLEGLQRAMQAMSNGSFSQPVPALDRGDEIGEVARSFVDMRQQTQNLISDLERRIARRTRDMETTQEISNFATTQRNLQALMDDVVELIVERFANIYHAQIFLVDSDNRFAVLRASTGTIGSELISRGHRLAIGSISVIGQVTAQGEVIIARDTTASDVHRKNEFLPETRAELAIPLKLGDRLIGALDVQSKEASTFDRAQIGVLTSMANQIAIAIENTRLYQESVQRLRNIETQTRQQTRRVWQEYMYDNRALQLVQQAGTPTNVDFNSLRERALKTNRAAIGEETERNTIPIAVPLRLRGEVIGAVGWELSAKEYNSNQIQLAQDLADRLALTLDNIRLFEQSQRATERERLVNDISAKLTTSTDVNRILQTAVREVGQALGAPQVSIRLSRRDSTGTFESPQQDDSQTHGN